MTLKNHMKKLGIVLLALFLFSFIGKQSETIIAASREDLTQSCITFNMIKPHGLKVDKIQIMLNTQAFVIEDVTWRETPKMDELTFEIPLRKDQHLLSPTITLYSGKSIIKTMQVQDDFVGGETQLYSFYK